MKVRIEPDEYYPFYDIWERGDKTFDVTQEEYDWVRRVSAEMELVQSFLGSKYVGKL